MVINRSEPEEDTMESPKGTTQGPARARVTATEKRRHRDAEAARLRASGLSYDDIADKLKFRDRSGARKAAQRALAGMVHSTVDEARQLSMSRLDGLRRMLVGLVTEGGLVPRDTIAAARALLAVEEREARLLGLDAAAAPVVTSGHLDAEIERLTREIGALDNLPVPDPWERADWTPPGQHLDDDDGRPGAEVVPLRTIGHDRGDRR
jgi:hypothetical protein